VTVISSTTMTVYTFHEDCTMMLRTPYIENEKDVLVATHRFNMKTY